MIKSDHFFSFFIKTVTFLSYFILQKLYFFHKMESYSAKKLIEFIQLNVIIKS